MDPLVNTELKEIKPLCAVCQEESAGFHFGAFTCEGCKSFFGRCTEDARVVISECKTGGNCNIKGRSRTSCKSCRLRKCQMVGMSRQRSRYGRRSHYFKVQCLLEAQQQHNRAKIQHHGLDHQTTQPVVKQEDITQFSSSLFPSLPLAQFSSQELHCPPQFSPTSVIKSTTSSAPSSSSNSAQIYKPVPLFPSPISPPSLQSFASALDSKIPQELQAYMAMWWPWASPASPTLSSSIPGSPSSTSSSLELTERGGGLRSGMEGLHIQQTEPLDLSVQQTEPLDLSMKPREKFSITGSRQESVLKFASHN